MTEYAEKKGVFIHNLFTRSKSQLPLMVLIMLQYVYSVLSFTILETKNTLSNV